MTYDRAKDMCGQRAAIYRASEPDVKYWRANAVPFDLRIPNVDKTADDWEVTQ